MKQNKNCNENTSKDFLREKAEVNVSHSQQTQLKSFNTHGNVSHENALIGGVCATQFGVTFQRNDKVGNA